MTVTTLVPQADPTLLTPEQADPDNINNTRTHQVAPEHIPILEAYLEALQTSYLVYSTWPADPHDPRLLAAPNTPEYLTGEQEYIRDFVDRGEVLNVEQGTTFRPWVGSVGDDTAKVVDCQIDGTFWQNAQTGEPLPPTENWPASPGHIGQGGVRWTLVSREGQWLIASGQYDSSVCG